MLNIANKIYSIIINMSWSLVFKQFKEWNFHLSGVGLFPRTLDTQRVITPLGYHSSLIINFQNPTLECVIIDIILTSMLFFLHFTCHFEYNTQNYFFFRDSKHFGSNGHFRDLLVQLYHFITENQI